MVNQLDNNISGNSGQNEAKFSENSSQYSIEKQDNDATIITDMVSNRDGINTLAGIENAVFTDSSIRL